MARSREIEKHPALLSKEKVRERFQAEDEKLMYAIPGWETFTPLDKQFLAVLPYAGKKKAAAELVGKSYQWYFKRRATKPFFSAAVDSRTRAPSDVLYGWVTDALAQSGVKLMDLILQESWMKPDKKLQLEAIKHLHSIAGIGREASAPVTSQSYIQAQQIQIFQGARSNKNVPSQTLADGYEDRDLDEEDAMGSSPGVIEGEVETVEAPSPPPYSPTSASETARAEEWDDDEVAG